jgi:RHS repeat-associated protein
MRATRAATLSAGVVERLSRGGRGLPAALLVALLVVFLSGAVSASAQGGFPGGVIVSVGYADSLRQHGFFPTPWSGDAGVIFEGCAPTSSCSYDGGGVKVTNTSNAAVTVNQLQVKLSTCTYNIWPTTISLPAGQSLVYAQMVSGADNGCTASGTFDTSDVGPNGVGWSGNCSQSGVIPEVDVTANGVLQAFTDSGQVLNTGGKDLASCPSGSNESEPWTQINGGVTAGQQYGGSNPSAPQLVGCNHGAPVDCATGDFWHTFDEISIPGRGVPLDLNLTYNSLAAAQNSPLGFGWSFSYGMHLAFNQSTGDVTVMQENGSTVPFTNAGGSYQAPTYVAASLLKNGDGSYTLTRRHGGHSFKFSAAGTLLSINDRNGYTTTLAYNGGQLATVTDPAGRSLSFTYGANGDISQISDPGTRTVGFGYNGAGELTSITDTNNGVTSFTYDASAHRLLTMTDPRNDGAWTNHYNSNGQVDSQTDPLTRATAYAYAAGTTTITDPKGNVTQEHFSNLLPVAVTQGYGSSAEATWKYAYDPATLGRTSITDPNNHISTATYDGDGNQTSFKDALARTTTATYNSFDEPLVVKDPSLVSTTRTYDGQGNLLTVSRPLDTDSSTQTVTLAYTDSSHPGDLTSITDAKNKTAQIGYDNYGDIARITDPLGDKSTYTYNALGQLTSSVSPRGNAAGADPAQYTSTYQYNGLGLLTHTTDPLNHTTTSVYDGDGNLTSLTDADNNTTGHTYDADNELTKTTRADTTTLQYGYDPNGNQNSQTDGNNKTTSYGYDPLDRLSSITDPLNRATRYTSDGAGNRKTVVDPSNRTTTYGYNDANELNSISYSDGTTPSASYSYTANGQRKTMVDGTGTTSYSYDSLNRLTSQTNGSNQTVAYGYDLDNHLTSLIYPGNHTVTRTYDDAGRLTKISDWLSHATTITPDADSNTGTIAYPNGITASSNFDHADQVSSVTDKNAGGSTIASFTYTRDGNGQLQSTTPTGTGQGSNESYTYNTLNQLTAVNTKALSYDAADNITKLANGATLGYDAANQATSYTPQGGSASTLTYDQQGDRLTGLGASYTYDQADRLISASGASGSVAIDGAAEDGLSVRKSDGTVWGWGYNGNGQLGNGTTTNSTIPVQATGLSGATTVASGAYFTLAIKSDGTVWAWGDNTFGQLGNGTTADSHVPVQTNNLSGVTAVSAGHYHSLALKSDGTVWAWGRNDSGQLGNGTTTNASAPVKVSNLTGVVTVAAGGDYSLALKSDGTVWAWGANTYGQLGNNSSKSSSVPVQVRNLTAVVRISAAPPIAAGYEHSLAVKSDGTVWAWGYNANGQLGNGTTKNSLVPVQVKNLTGATGVAAGAYHSLAVKSDGTVWAWGYNFDGELGNGTTTNSSLPLQVPNLTGVSTVAAGDFTSYVLKSDGSVWDWGYNGDSELGNGGTTNSNVPVQPTGLGKTTQTNYSYDGNGLRASAAINGTTQHFAWDISSSLPLMLTDGSTSYVYDDTGNPVEQIDINGTPLYYQHDQLGSTRLLTNQTGTTVATYTYDAYGNLAAYSGTADTPLRWNAQYQDASGLYYLRARFYDPQTAQFLTRDPFGLITQQIYSYAANNPLNGADPLGLWCWNPTSLHCWTSDISAVAGAASAVVAFVPGLEAEAAALAVIAFAADIVGCLTSECDYASLAFDALALVPGAAAYYWADKAEGLQIVRAMLLGALDYDPWLGRIRYFEGLFLYVDRAYKSELLARAEAAGRAGAVLSGLGVASNLTSGNGGGRGAPC